MFCNVINDPRWCYEGEGREDAAREGEGAEKSIILAEDAVVDVVLCGDCCGEETKAQGRSS